MEQVIQIENGLYPELLRHSSYPPKSLYYEGDVGLLNNDNLIAVVGTRRMSEYGKEVTRTFVRGLVDAGYVIVSGLASGIDASAHRSSLKYGTVAVMANGIDYIYPPENKKLYSEIIEHGLVITEQAFGSLPKAIYFPQRNRIILGLSLATAVVEASFKSGSLITAKFAAEQNRDVFAVPGFPLDLRYSGTNYLIKQGANLLESSEDIFNVLRQGIRISKKCEQVDLDLLNGKTTKILQNKDIDGHILQKDLDKIHELVLSKLGTTPVSIDQLIQEIGISMSSLPVVLIELELAGNIKRVGSNQVMLVI